MKKNSNTVGTFLLSEKYIFVLVSFIVFSIPFFFSKSQILTGSIVNTALFLSVIFLPKKYFLPIIVLPSLAVLSRGLIFGPFTPFLVYFLPIIWLGNFILIKTFQYFFKVKYFTGILTAALLKWLVLYLFASLFFSLHLIPKIFLQTMGIYQFITAIVGGVISLFIYRKINNGKL